MTSAIFQSEGNVDVRKEQLIISVRGPSTTCKQSLNTLALTLSGPGDLFNGSDKMTRLTSSQLTGLKLKHSSVGGTGGRREMFAKVILLSLASLAAVSAARLPTDEKYKLKSFTTDLRSFE